MLKETFPIVVLVVLSTVTIVQLLYYFGLFSFISFAKKRKTEPLQPPVSIVMVVKESVSVLMKTLPHYLEQQYPNFEIVLVDDNSNDETQLLAREYQQQYPFLKIVDLATSRTTIRGRKFALSVGIRCATFENIILADAECVPSSTHWLETMASHFNGKTKIVIGYSTYAKKNNPFNRLLHFDTLQNGLQFLALARKKSAYRGDGRNMGYTKTLFGKQRGFASHNHLAYGEEDIFICRAATRNNTDIEFSPDSFTVLHRGAILRFWKDHKEGLYYTRKFNTLKNRILLGGYELTTLLFYASAVFAILLTINQMVFLSVALGIVLLRVISQYLVFGFAAAKLNEKQVIPGLLIYDVVFALLNPLYHLAAQIHHKRFQ